MDPLPSPGTSLALLACLSLAAAGCGLLPSEVDVDLDHPLFVAGGMSVVQPQPLPGVGSEIRQTLSNEGVPMDRVAAIHVSRLELVHLQPDCEMMAGCDLGFIESLELLVESPGLDEARLGSVESPGSTRITTFEIEDVDLAPYARAESMTLVARIALERHPIQDVSMEARVTLTVDIDI